MHNSKIFYYFVSQDRGICKVQKTRFSSKLVIELQGFAEKQLLNSDQSESVFEKQEIKHTDYQVFTQNRVCILFVPQFIQSPIYQQLTNFNRLLHREIMA